MHGVHGVCFFGAFVVKAAFGCEAPHCIRVEIMSKEAFLFLFFIILSNWHGKGYFYPLLILDCIFDLNFYENFPIMFGES